MTSFCLCETLLGWPFLFLSATQVLLRWVSYPSSLWSYSLSWYLSSPVQPSCHLSNFPASSHLFPKFISFLTSCTLLSLNMSSHSLFLPWLRLSVTLSFPACCFSLSVVPTPLTPVASSSVQFHYFPRSQLQKEQEKETFPWELTDSFSRSLYIIQCFKE